MLWSKVRMQCGIVRNSDEVFVLVLIMGAENQPFE